MLGITAALLFAAVPAVADPSITSKRAEAQRVEAQIMQMDSSLEKAIEAYDLASTQLGRIQHDLKTNEHDLVVARRNLQRGQKALAARLVALYTSDQSNTTLDVLLGSKSLDDMLSRLDTVNRVSGQGTAILHDVTHFRGVVRSREAALKTAHARQQQIVAQRAAQRVSIQSQIQTNRQQLSALKGEIARLQSVEQQRQLQMAHQVQTALAAQEQQAHQAMQDTIVGAAAVAPEGVAVAPPSQYSGAAGIAMRYLGTPYVWGGSSPGGFDCSGLVAYVFAQLGVSLPHNAAAQYGYGVPVSQDQLEPGDLVFFDGLGHVGIYVGGGSFVHAPHSGDVVKISSLSESWYASTYVGARRIT